MTRRARHNDPTVPTYLPPWPQRWPRTTQQANRTIDDMHPRAATARAGRVLASTAATVAAVLLLITMHPIISIPLIIGTAAALCGIAEKHRRRRARAERHRQAHRAPRSRR